MSWSSMVPWGDIMNNNNDQWDHINKSGTTKKVLSQEAIDKIIYDISSSNQGLAELARGENMSGGFGTSTKTLMAQDFYAKLAGELANVTAETVITANEDNQKTKRSAVGGQFSVICTEFARTGELDWKLYAAGEKHFLSTPVQTINGYLTWAFLGIDLMNRSPLFRRFMLSVVKSRYQMLVTGKFGILGAITIHLGEPLCYLIGKIGAKNGWIVA